MSRLRVDEANDLKKIADALERLADYLAAEGSPVLDALSLIAEAQGEQADYLKRLVELAEQEADGE